MGLFVGSFIGQVATGFAVHNETRRDHRMPSLSFGGYLASGHFVEATFENWESEFLQMGLFVLLTVKLKQKGSSESKVLDGDDDCDEDPSKHRDDPDAPWPVRRGGWVLWLYERSLTIALFAIFFASFALHALGGWWEQNFENELVGKSAMSVWDFLGSSSFWFQSFQNWQSEFLSVLALVVLSIYLRQKGSPQSKRVAAPHSETGEHGG